MSGIDVIELAKALIRCPSITPKEGGAITLLEHTLTRLGFNCYRLAFSEEGAPEVENLYARIGTTSPNFCFAGHTDVVPPGDEAKWSVPPFAPDIIDGVLYGRGVVDMKGSIAAFLAATSLFLKEHGSAWSGSISFLITGDEEGPALCGTRKVLEWLRDRKEDIAACLVGEPTNPTRVGEMIKIGRRGSITFHLDIYGVQGHVAYPHLAKNPIPLLAHIIKALSQYVFDAGDDYFDPSHLEWTSVDVGNTADNVIPEKASAVFNIRFNNFHTPTTLVRIVEDVCNHALKSAPEARYTLRHRASAEAFITEPCTLHDIIKDAVHTETGITPVFSTTGGTSDARFIKDICPVVEFGLCNTTAHKIDECASVEDLQLLVMVYKRILETYFNVRP